MNSQFYLFVIICELILKVKVIYKSFKLIKISWVQQTLDKLSYVLNKQRFIFKPTVLYITNSFLNIVFVAYLSIYTFEFALSCPDSFILSEVDHIKFRNPLFYPFIKYFSFLKMLFQIFINWNCLNYVV